MSWAYGIVGGREVGYSVAAECDQAGCHEEIDRGLAFCCGGMHGGGEFGCGGYFCYKHLIVASVNGKSATVCEICFDMILDAGMDDSQAEDEDEQNLPITSTNSEDNWVPTGQTIWGLPVLENLNEKIERLADELVNGTPMYDDDGNEIEPVGLLRATDFEIVDDSAEHDEEETKQDDC